MTTFSDADFDLLADFVGGALDGTPEADDVRRLVSTDDRPGPRRMPRLVTAEVAVRDRADRVGRRSAARCRRMWSHRLDAALQAARDAPLPQRRPGAGSRPGPGGAAAPPAASVGAAWPTAAAVLICGGFGVSLVAGEQAGKGDTIRPAGRRRQRRGGPAAGARSAASGWHQERPRGPTPPWWPPARTTGRGRSGSWRRLAAGGRDERRGQRRHRHEQVRAARSRADGAAPPAGPGGQGRLPQRGGRGIRWAGGTGRLRPFRRPAGTGRHLSTAPGSVPANAWSSRSGRLRYRRGDRRRA